MKPLAREFASFRKAVIADDASKAQVDDMEAAFFAGAICTLGVLVKTLVRGVDDSSKEQAVQRLADMVAECRAFDAGMRADAVISRAMEDKQ
jgi:hypothetical protein